MTQPQTLSTWEGKLTATELAELLSRVQSSIFIGQRPGGFLLTRENNHDTGAWPSGRCFNETLEIRWWPTEETDARNVLILNGLPTGWSAPEGWECHRALSEVPRPVRYLCVGEYDQASGQWWEARYGQAFRYLDSMPPTQSANRDGQALQDRVQLVAMVYELADGRSQHRLVRFEPAQAKEEAR